MDRFNELMGKIRDRSISYYELRELKTLLEKRIRMCEEKEKCDEAASEHFLLRIVENFLEKYFTKAK
jgi:hypothetical protein